MRHRTSGLLAWVSLAIIIGVPTTEVLLSKPNKKSDDVVVSKKEIKTEEPIITTSPNVEVSSNIVPQAEISEPLKPNKIRNLEEENLPRSVALLDLSAVFPDAPTNLPHSPIPNEFSLASKSLIKNNYEYKPKQNIAISLAPFPKPSPSLHTRIVGDAGMTIGSRIKQIKDNREVVSQENSSKNIEEQTIDLSENGIDEEFLKSQSLQQETQNESLVAIAPVNKARNGLIVEKYNSIIRIGRDNIDRNKATRKLNIIRVPARQTVRPVNFYDLIATKQVSAHIITIRPSNRQRLDLANNSGVTRVGYASQAQVHENIGPSNRFVTHGSFISQLPPTRGSSVRLDLLN